MTITVAGLGRSIRRVAPAADRCIHLALAGGRLRIAATDRHRLAVAELRADGGGELRALVPADALLALDLGDEPVQLSFDATLSIDGREVEVVDDVFPDIERILDALDAAVTVDVEAAALLDAIESADDDGPLPFVLAAGALRLGDRALAVAYEGPDVSMHVNGEYAHAAVVAAESDVVSVEVLDHLSPVAFRAPDGHVTLVMPVRVAPRRR